MIRTTPYAYFCVYWLTQSPDAQCGCSLIYQLMQTLQHEPEELLRAVVGLLFTRVITLDKELSTAHALEDSLSQQRF